MSLASLSESDEYLSESEYGCIRLKPYTERSDYDMFSWLASEHRLAPMPVHLLSNNDETILRWALGEEKKKVETDGLDMLSELIA